MMPTEANTHIIWNSSNRFNETTFPKLDDKIRAERIASLVCGFLGVLVTMYIIVSMVYHGYRTKRLCSCGVKKKKIFTHRLWLDVIFVNQYAVLCNIGLGFDRSTTRAFL
ncbi:unnamed protein product [Clavelina lepadiformis]|uniref:Uncharacterized protein n=1 Tax=Clavelina lepadiformis TaxID=159417 RepID=A0ABP0FT29_CLALP